MAVAPRWFLNVPPGDYVIQVNRDRSNSWTEGAFGAGKVALCAWVEVALRLIDAQDLTERIDAVERVLALRRPAFPA